MPSQEVAPGLPPSAGSACWNPFLGMAAGWQNPAGTSAQPRFFALSGFFFLPALLGRLPAGQGQELKGGLVLT